SLRQPLQTLASVNKGPGTRLSLVTVLAGAVDPHTRVPYKAHAFGEAYRLTGYSVVPAGLELLADYEHALGFLDALGSASRFLGEPVSRLEAHDLMWYVLRYTAPETWSADDVSALHRFLRRSETSTSLAERAELELDAIAEQEAEEDAPADDDEARRRVLRAIWERRGQPKFRQEVGDAYGGRCAITNCDCSEALEAAHIRAMADEGANAVSNGILLRGDVHTLFDRGLLAIDVSTWKVVLAPALRTGSYSDLHGAAFRRPEADALAPAEDALRAHRKACGF
ncbi:MAG TPA: HNH endonuclease, partial [Polyangiaceae bacterium]|nr:HNH endonuclease [Polyangiaceae bacterium]